MLELVVGLVILILVLLLVDLLLNGFVGFLWAGVCGVMFRALTFVFLIFRRVDII